MDIDTSSEKVMNYPDARFTIGIRHVYYEDSRNDLLYFILKTVRFKEKSDEFEAKFSLELLSVQSLKTNI